MRLIYDEFIEQIGVHNFVRTMESLTEIYGFYNYI